MTDETLLQTRSLTKEFRGFRAVYDVDLEVETAPCTRWSAPTARARPRCSTCSPASSQPTVGHDRRSPARDITGKPPGADRAPRASPARSRSPASSTQLTAARARRAGAARPHRARAAGSGGRRSAARPVPRPRPMELLDQVGPRRRSPSRPAGSLAYGQKRALELALALALDPKLLLLDEPTAGMGIEDVDRTIELVKRVAAGPHRRARRPQHARRRQPRRPGHRAAGRPGPGRGHLRRGAHRPTSRSTAYLGRAPHA